MSWEEAKICNEPFDAAKHFAMPSGNLSFQYLKDGQPMGPFTSDQMYGWNLRGYFTRDTKVRINQYMAWTRIGKLWPNQEDVPFEHPPRVLIYNAEYKKSQQKTSAHDRRAADDGSTSKASSSKTKNLYSLLNFRKWND